MNSSKIKFFNTLGNQKQDFSPINEEEVKIYTCGPTVYNYTHIGNLRAYVFADLLCRTLRYNGFKVRQIMNITDIGHLTGDGDVGVDKMTKGLMREGKELTLKNMRKLAEFYTEKFKDDLKALNVIMPQKMLFASDYIKEDIDLIKKLEAKNFTYKTSDGIYFDTAKMPDYGILWNGKRVWNEAGARIAENSEKKNGEDFVLWKFSKNIGFESIWGMGFPGWHIECSAMSMKFLGEQFDIHTAGIDLIPTHHTNEIAQSECATGKKPFVRFWIHSEHVDTGGEKMAKSTGNFLQLQNLKDRKIDPISYRFWLLMASYRTKVNFVWEAIEGTEIALKRLFKLYLDLGPKIGKLNKEYQNKFKEFINNDLDTAKGVVLLWDLVKDEKISPADKKATILDFDKVLGLGFSARGGSASGGKKEKIPKEIEKLVKEREQARQNKDFKKSDELRSKINSLGYEIKDSDLGPQISKI